MNYSETITNKKRTLIFINLIITCVASSMLATALTTALPRIMEDFGISAATGQWLTGGYSLAMGIVLPLSAFLIHRFPARKLYLTAIATFMAGLILSVMSGGFAVMMCGRVLQALGNGTLASMAQVIILTIYPDDRKGSAMGWYGLSVGAAPVVAPALAGLLVDSFGWKMIFYAALAIMAVSLIFALCVFGNVLDNVRRKFDLPSFALSALAFTGITLGTGNMGIYPFVSVHVLLMLGAGVFSAAVFVLRQFRLDEPFLQLEIFKNKDYALSVAGSMILYLVMMGSSVILPLYVQTIKGYSAAVSGLVTLPGSLIMALISPFAGKLYDRVGIKLLFVVGALCMLLSNIGMARIDMQTSIWIAAGYNALRCVSLGCLIAPVVTWGTRSIDENSTADASALLTSLRTVSGAIGSAVFVSIMTAAANRSAETYGDNAQIYGLNAAFFAMAAASAVLLAIAVLGVKNKSGGSEKGR